jgi:hypothetical protein
LVRQRTRRALSAFKNATSKALHTLNHDSAIGGFLLAIALLIARAALGILSHTAFLQSAALVLLSGLAFFLVFRSGLNHRCIDPSLTGLQILNASAIVLYIMYAADPGMPGSEWRATVGRQASD